MSTFFIDVVLVAEVPAVHPINGDLEEVSRDLATKIRGVEGDQQDEAYPAGLQPDEVQFTGIVRFNRTIEPARFIFASLEFEAGSDVRVSQLQNRLDLDIRGTVGSLSPPRSWETSASYSGPGMRGILTPERKTQVSQEEEGLPTAGCRRGST